jgi:Kunitz/Bovine pancreatic trypsin inhibitor domain
MNGIILFGAIVVLTTTSNCTKLNEECQTKCSQVGETGSCKALFKKYYFDKTEKKCKEFIWGGCEGVVPFQTLEECQSCGCK